MKIWINIQTTQNHNHSLYITATSTTHMKYIIEHLEEKVYPWCLLEYTHISTIVGKDNLIFTNIAKKHLGKEQSPTDNAVYVAKEILENHKSLEDLNYQDTLEIDIDKGESIILPFRYVLINNQPLLAPGFKEFLKKQKMF